MINLIPTEIKTCKNSAFDFLEFRKIGERIKQTKNGYDHCFIFDDCDGILRKRAKIKDNNSVY